MFHILETLFHLGSQLILSSCFPLQFVNPWKQESVVGDSFFFSVDRRVAVTAAAPFRGIDSVIPTWPFGLYVSDFIAFCFEMGQTAVTFYNYHIGFSVQHYKGVCIEMA